MAIHYALDLFSSATTMKPLRVHLCTLPSFQALGFLTVLGLSRWPLVIIWNKSPVSPFKLNVDWSSLGHPAPIGGGYILCDSDSHVIFAESTSLLDGSSLWAELQAMTLGFAAFFKPWFCHFCC